MMCVEMHSDREAVRHVRYYWRRWWSLGWWQFGKRREALRKARYWRDVALDSPSLPPPGFGGTRPIRR